MVIFLIMALLPGIDFSFRFKALFFILIARLITAGIFAIAYKNNNKTKKNTRVPQKADMKKKMSQQDSIAMADMAFRRMPEKVCSAMESNGEVDVSFHMLADYGQGQHAFLGGAFNQDGMTSLRNRTLRSH